MRGVGPSNTAELVLLINHLPSHCSLLPSTIMQSPCAESPLEPNPSHPSEEQSLQLFRTLIDRLDDAIEVIDAPTGRFLDVNDRGCLDLGYSREELRSLSVSDIDPLVTPTVYQRNLEKLRAEGSLKIESLHRRRDGSCFPVEINVRLIRLDREYTLTVVRDITERRKLEEQLRHTHKMEAIGRLAGGIAHEFNNLLTVITGYASLLLEPLTLGHPQRESLIEIQDAGQRAAALVRQLLTFSHGQVLQPTVLDLNEVVEQSETFFRRLLGDQIELVIRTERNLAKIRDDRGQIEQVLINLVLNARDAMPAGGRLEIQSQNVEFVEPCAGIGNDLPPGRYVRLSVGDNGHGMTPAVKAKIFEPFYTTKEVGRGTGLGLSVVHGIVQQSGGQIEIESEFGVGSCFAILLPAWMGQQVQAMETDSFLSPMSDSAHERGLPTWGTGERLVGIPGTQWQNLPFSHSLHFWKTAWVIALFPSRKDLSAR